MSIALLFSSPKQHLNVGRAAKLWKPKELKIHENFNSWNENITKMGDYRVNIALVRLEGGESVRTHPSLDDGRFSREGSTQTVKGYIMLNLMDFQHLIIDYSQLDGASMKMASRGF